MFTIAKRSLLLLLFGLITIRHLHAQSDFISVNASANAAATALVADKLDAEGITPATKQYTL